MPSAPDQERDIAVFYRAFLFLTGLAAFRYGRSARLHFYDVLCDERVFIC